MEEERSTSSLSESLDNSGEIVANSPTLKTLIAAIGASIDAALSGSPAPLGSVLSTWLVARADEIEKQRMEEQFVLLLQQLKTLEGQVVKRDYFETGEGRDMLIKAVDEARRTRSRLKKELYAQILKGAILDFEQREYSSEEYLHLISDLTEQEIKVAFSAYEERLPPDESEVWKSWAQKVCSQLGMDIADLRFALGRIASSGLLRRMFWYGSAHGVYATQPDEDEVGMYRFTPGFRKLMWYMEREE